MACALSAALFGAATPAAKLVLDHIPPVTLAGLLYLGAALVAGPAVAIQPIRRPPKRDLAKVAGSVIVGGALAPVLLLIGLDRTPASTASLLLNLELVSTALLAGLFFGEHIGRRAGGGLAALTAAGMLLAGAGGSIGIGSVLIVGACICWGLDNNLTATATGVTPAQITLLKGVVAGLVNLGIGLATEHPTLSPAPFIGMALGWSITGEPVLGSQVGALVVMAVGVTLVTSSSHQHEHFHAAESHEHVHRHDDGHHDHGHVEPITGSHSHPHDHPELVHSHAHHPDAAHRHRHEPL